MTKKLYLIKINLGDEVPLYIFCLEAENMIEANEKAEKVSNKDYPDYDFKIIRVTPIKTIADLKAEFYIE